MRKFVVGAIVVAALIAAGFGAYAYFNSDPYAGWAVVVASGDFHAHDGGPSRAFDNARRDVVTELEHVGFRKENIRQYSAWSRYFARDASDNTSAETISNLLAGAAKQAPDGCLVYFSTHGTPYGIILGDEILRPSQLRDILDKSCKDKPTVVVLSACYSGVFVPKLAAPNRMIVTAARKDRTSFGCGTTNRYPYYDTCFLHTLSQAHDFRSLAYKTKDCVAEMEAGTGMEPPSEPQISIGKNVLAELKGW
ncbi:MAG TPA: C13 family peptidase [Rhizomicrobium sp.]|nr:C13 family peptidase [Rhizomicrobium sp.]